MLNENENVLVGLMINYFTCNYYIFFEVKLISHIFSIKIQYKETIQNYIHTYIYIYI